MKLFRKTSVATAVIAACTTLATFGAQAQTYTGKASFYSSRHRTASGGHVGSLTCAHRYLPLGSKVRVTNTANHRSVVLTVNDRGPFVGGRIIDVATPAARLLGFIGQGVARVIVQTL